MKGNRLFAFACLWLSTVSCFAAAPPLSIQPLAGGQLQITWPGDAAGFSLEQADSLRSPVGWQTVNATVANTGGVLSVTIASASQTRFYRLRQAASTGATVVETSPAAGESGVAVTRETILRFSAPLAAGTIIDQQRLHAAFGGRRLLARPELSGDRRTLTLFYLENLPASARVNVTFDGNGLKDAAGTEINPDGDGNAGGTFQLSFTTAGISGLPGTAVIGRVFASEKNPDGSNRPLQNVIVTVDGAEETLRTFTDATGAFTLSPAPAGRFFVHVDGRTAVGSQWPGGAYYPFVGKAWDAVAGRTNNLAGGSGEIFLPLIQADALQAVSATAETKITFSPGVLAANPTLAGVEIMVPPNALFSDNGTRGGRVGLAPVPADRLPEPLPPGLNLPLVITVQTDGGSNFDAPVPVKFPNLPDPVTGVKLGPGEKTVLWSFNHDTGRWEIQGTMTISADGNFAVTDPGVGIRQPGWHGTAPGTPAASSPTPNPSCTTCPRCDGDQELKMWFGIVDLGMDTALLPINMAPGLGCATGFALSGLRSTRDCAFLDVDECPTSLRNNLINGALGCIPVFGSLLGTTLSAGQTANEIDKYYDNCAGQAAALARTKQAFIGDGTSFLQDLEKARDLMLLQDEVNQALANLNALILGSPAWRSVEWRTPGSEYIRLLQAVRAAVDPSSPLAEAISPEERTVILQMPRPGGISPANVEALVNRFANTVPKGLQIPPAAANLAVFDQAMDLLDQVSAQGWRNPNDGAIQAIIILSRLLEPLPPGTLLASTGGGDGAGVRVFPSGRHHYLLVNLETGFATRGQTSPQGMLQGLILAPNTRYGISYYTTAASGLLGASSTGPRLGMAMFTSQAAGALTRIPYAVLVEDEFPDSDGDGISDHAEVILGTGAYGADSDNDGIPDGQELALGSNPLDGVGLPLGVVGAAPTSSAAFDVALENNLAGVACAQALAVFDVSNPQSPVQTASVSGAANQVALRGTLALAAFADGVRLVDLSTPGAPVVLWARTDLGVCQAVAFGIESVFVGTRTELRRLDLATGSDAGSLTISNLDSLVARGGLIYGLAGASLTIGRDSDWVELIRTVSAPGGGGAGSRPRRLALAGNLLYAQHNFGFNVFDLANPEWPALIRDVVTSSAGWRQLAPTGTGFAFAAVGPNSTADGPHDVSLYRLVANGTDAQFVTLFETPGQAYAVAVAGARGYVADGTAGLAVVNFLDPDLAGIPPTVIVSVDSTVTPPKVEGGSLARVAASATDDVAVRHVDFFVNGQFVTRDDSFPFEMFHRVAPVSPGTTLRVRARAEDRAGNASESAELTVLIVEDATPPAITGIDPAPGAVVPPSIVTDVTVAFNEAIVTPVSASTLTLRSNGTDGVFDTADDQTFTGDAQWIPAEKTIRFRNTEPLLSGRYRAFLAGGLADAAGNVRVPGFTWEFETGPPPFVSELFPPSNYVRVGGTLDELVFGFDQPLPRILADTYVWKVSRRVDSGPLTEVTPLQVLHDATRRVFRLRTATTFPPGFYRVTGSGPNVQGMFWEFYFRDVPNEWILHESGVGTWKHFPGPAPDDSLIINAPGQPAALGFGRYQSIIAHTDVRLGGASGGDFEVAEPIQLFAGLELLGTTRFKGGETHVRGLLAFRSASDFNVIDIGPHTLNAYGGGYLRSGGIRFTDPNGALVNHSGSTFVLSNATVVANTGIPWNNAGRIVNLGTLRSLGADVRLEDVRVRNDGRLEVAAGALKMNSVDNGGVIDVVAGAKLLLPLRTRGGVSSHLAGTGTVEFGEYNSSTRRVVASADAELRGDIDPALALTLVAGNVTLYKPFIRPAGAI